MPFSENRHPENDIELDKPEPGSFAHKGIGANMLLTTAAALVPMIILGVSAFATVAGRKKSAKGKRSASK